MPRRILFVVEDQRVGLLLLVLHAAARGRRVTADVLLELFHVGLEELLVADDLLLEERLARTRVEAARERVYLLAPLEVRRPQVVVLQVA